MAEHWKPTRTIKIHGLEDEETESPALCIIGISAEGVRVFHESINGMPLQECKLIYAIATAAEIYWQRAAENPHRSPHNLPPGVGVVPLGATEPEGPKPANYARMNVAGVPLPGADPIEETRKKLSQSSEALRQFAAYLDVDPAAFKTVPELCKPLADAIVALKRSKAEGDRHCARLLATRTRLVTFLHVLAKKLGLNPELHEEWYSLPAAISKEIANLKESLGKGPLIDPTALVWLDKIACELAGLDPESMVDMASQGKAIREAVRKLRTTTAHGEAKQLGKILRELAAGAGIDIGPGRTSLQLGDAIGKKIRAMSDSLVKMGDQRTEVCQLIMVIVEKLGIHRREDRPLQAVADDILIKIGRLQGAASGPRPNIDDLIGELLRDTLLILEDIHGWDDASRLQRRIAQAIGEKMPTATFRGHKIEGVDSVQIDIPEADEGHVAGSVSPVTEKAKRPAEGVTWEWLKQRLRPWPVATTEISKANRLLCGAVSSFEESMGPRALILLGDVVMGAKDVGDLESEIKRRAVSSPLREWLEHIIIAMLQGKLVELLRDMSPYLHKKYEPAAVQPPIEEDGALGDAERAGQADKADRQTASDAPDEAGAPTESRPPPLAVTPPETDTYDDDEDEALEENPFLADGEAPPKEGQQGSA